MDTKKLMNLGAVLVVAGIIFYLGEEDTTLVLIALAAIAYLLIANSKVVAL